MTPTESTLAELDNFAKTHFKSLKEDFLEAHTGITEEQYNADHDKTVDSTISDIIRNLKKIARQESVTAHRVVFAREVNPSVGKHWSLEPLTEGNFDALLEMAQRTDPTLRAKDARVFTAQIPTKDIDLIGTLRTNAQFPFEEEILLRVAPNIPKHKPIKRRTPKKPPKKKTRTPTSLKGIR